MHHLPEYYDDPYQFNPSRFDPDQKQYVQYTLIMYVYSQERKERVTNRNIRA